MAVSMWAPEEGADSAASSLGRLWKGMPLRTFIAVMNDCNDFNKVGRAKRRNNGEETVEEKTIHQLPHRFGTRRRGG